MKKSTLFAVALAAASLTATAAPKTVWTGDKPLGSWSNIVEIPDSCFKDAKTGDYITVLFKDVDDNPDAPGQVQLALKSVEDWTWTQLNDYADINNNTYEYVILNECVGDSEDTDLEMLKAHGLNIKGQNATVSAVLLGEKYVPDTPTPPAEEVVWEDAEGKPLGSWNNIVEINEKCFQNAIVGTEIVISFKDVSDNPDAPGQVQLALKSVEDWTWTQLNDYDDIKNDSFTYKVLGECVEDSDDTDLEMLKAHGLNIKGQNATVIKVTLKNNSGEHGIKGVTVDSNIDWNAPVEYYTFDGRRISEPAKGLYIVRQGSKVCKIAK